MRLDFALAVNSGEGFGHLATIGVLNADKDNFLHQSPSDTTSRRELMIAMKCRAMGTTIQDGL